MSAVDLRSCARALASWRAPFEAFTAPATELVRVALPHCGFVRALDLASGIGDPSLALAAALRSHGRVTACDAVGPFLAQLEVEATRRELNNIRTVLADIQHLPFVSGSYDFVSSRFALHAIASTARTLRETYRVLGPGGRAVHVVWGATEQPLLRETVTEPMRRLGGPDFVTDEQGPFRFSSQGTLAALLTAAGFVDVEERAHESSWQWPGSAETLWLASCEVSAPLYEPLLDALAPHQRAELDRSVVDALLRFESNGTTTLPVSLRVVVGTKPHTSEA